MNDSPSWEEICQTVLRQNVCNNNVDVINKVGESGGQRGTAT